MADIHGRLASVIAPTRRLPFEEPEPQESELEPEPIENHRSYPDASSSIPDDATKAQAKELLQELTAAFRERQQFGSGGTRSPSGVAVERIKLLATYFNTVAAGLLTAGLIGPMAAYLYGFSTSQRSNLEIIESILIVFMLSIFLHLLARTVLGRLSP